RAPRPRPPPTGAARRRGRRRRPGSHAVVRALAVNERVVGRPVRDREDVGDEEGVVAGVRLGSRLSLDPAERAVDQRRDLSLACRHPLPVDNRRVPGREAARELLLLGSEQADREAPGAPQELVAGGVLADRDPDQRRIEGERDERGAGDPHPVALDVDAEDRDAVRPEPHQPAEILTRRHSCERYRESMGRPMGSLQDGSEKLASYYARDRLSPLSAAGGGGG